LLLADHTVSHQNLTRRSSSNNAPPIIKLIALSPSAQGLIGAQTGRLPNLMCGDPGAIGCWRSAKAGSHSMPKGQLHDYASDARHNPEPGDPVADTVPRYDVRATCRKAVALASGSEGRNVENCMMSEEAAHKDLEKDWVKAPAAERTQCIGTVAVSGSPSYVELLTCLEMMRDLRKHQEDERAAKKREPAGKT
jgi:hypothetical protein